MEESRLKNYLICILILLGLPLRLVAQFDVDPVSWSQQLEQSNDSTFTLVLEAEIEPDWHLYSQFTAEGGALPTEFTFINDGADYIRMGPVKESETHTEYSDIFEVDETFFKGKAIFSQEIRLLDPSINQVRVEVFYQVCKEVCISAERSFTFMLDGTEAPEMLVEIDAASRAKGEALTIALAKSERLYSGEAGEEPEKQSLWLIFGLGFIGGFIALLTPCVFPMIPLTVSFFTKRSDNKTSGVAAALFYGFCIVLIYVLLSLPFHLFDTVDSQLLNTIATNIWLNLFFFLVFVFFAFSFFGYYDITLPASWANKVDAASGKIGGGIGIFFMALTLAIVSFSCTGPILGGLLGSTALAEGEVATNLSVGMSGFGLALALPFALFALFPSWLNKLPSSGQWMETVKVVLGFLELGLAFKFLSNADLVGNWGLLKREVFLGIWILLALGLAAYLLGFFGKKGGIKPRMSLWRLGGVMLSLIFAGYLAYGLFYKAPLKWVSGFPPPDFYSLAENNSDCPLGLDCFKDFEKGLQHAQQVQKPILLDFTGWACVNCRRMEETVWSDPEVFSLIDEDFVLISLYVDDRTRLPEAEQFQFQYDSGRTKQIETIGDKWATFQNVNFKAVSQPFYVQLSPELEVLNPAIQNSDVATYRNWLASGLQTYEAGKSNTVFSSGIRLNP